MFGESKENFQVMSDTGFNGSSAFILFYDYIVPDTFLDLSKIVKISALAQNNQYYYLIGTNFDKVGNIFGLEADINDQLENIVEATIHRIDFEYPKAADSILSKVAEVIFD
ncbi:MAG: hypothetical protein IH840_07320 [Candidatus Heimdallarchaeota archaeon]|nr:hypothetical protein [Candidatus Heimdallarchaeota archaeon]